MFLKFWQGKSNKQKDLIVILLLIAIGVILYCFKMGALSLTEPDEVFYAQTAKEMLQRHTWSVPYIFGQPQFEKPILYYFLLAAGFKLLGIGAATARIWSALFGILGMVLTYLLGKAIYNRGTGFIAALVLATSFEYLSLSRAVLTDIVFSNLLLACLFSFYFGYLSPEKRTPWFLLSFAFSALATLTKGPIGIILPLFIMFGFLLLRKELKIFFGKEIFQGIIIFVLVALPWYWWIYGKFGQQFINEFFIRDNISRFFFVAEHINNDTWYYYVLTALGGFLPWSQFLVLGLVKLRWRQSVLTDEGKGILFLVCWVAVIFIFFSLAKSKLISYVFPIFPALAIVTGNYLYQVFLKQKEAEVRLARGFVSGTLILVLLFCAGSIGGWYYNKTAHYLSDRLALIPFYSLGLPAVVAFLLSLLKRYQESFALIILAIMSFLIAVGTTSFTKYLDPWVSSRESAEILRNYWSGEEAEVLLCNKSFARGLLYYAGLPVVVMDSSPNPFFAPHPITILHEDKEILQYLLSRPVTYCVVKKSNFETLESLAQEHLYLTTIYREKGRYILKIKPKS